MPRSRPPEEATTRNFRNIMKSYFPLSALGALLIAVASGAAWASSLVGRVDNNTNKVAKASEQAVAAEQQILRLSIHMSQLREQVADLKHSMKDMETKAESRHKVLLETLRHK